MHMFLVDDVYDDDVEWIRVHNFQLSISLAKLIVLNFAKMKSSYAVLTFQAEIFTSNLNAVMILVAFWFL